MATRYLAQGLGDIAAPYWQPQSAVDDRELRVAPDRGCQVSPSCLSCPLERCLEEYPFDQRIEILNRVRAG